MKPTKSKSPGRKIKTLDGLLRAMKQKLGPAATVRASNSISETYSPGSVLRSVYWTCSCVVTCPDGLQLKAEVYCCDTAEEALGMLLAQMSVEARKAGADAAAARALDERKSPRLAETKQPLLLGYNGKGS